MYWRQRRGLDLVVDHRGHDLAGVGAPGLEVEVAEHAPLQSGSELVLDSALDGDRLAELRDQLGEAQVDRVEPQLERALLAQLGLPRDPELLALGLGGGLPAVPVGVLDLVEREALAVVEDVLVVER